jgi:hypothetical protein
MSKELMQKIIEAGIVPAQAVEQLKAWKQVSDDLPDGALQNLTPQQFTGLVRGIEDLLENADELPELRETQPGLEARFEDKKQDCVVVVAGSATTTLNIPALADKHATSILSCVVFRADQYGWLAARVGNQLSLGDGNVYETTEATPLYQGEDVVFYRCDVQEVPDHAQMPELR